MHLYHPEGKLSFIVGIFTSLKEEITGGVIVMHKLAYELAKKGHSVYVFCEPGFPHENIKVLKASKTSQDGFMSYFTWQHFTYPLYTTVTIFPQTTRGNWFQTPNVARWILYDTEKDIEDGYGPDDVYFNFGSFKTFRNVPHRPLTVFDFKFDQLYNSNSDNRKTFCHIIHKHTPNGGEKIFELLGSENLTDWKTKGGYDYLREKFNQYEYFLTYDQKTFYTSAAGLCGTKSIILNPGPTYEFAPNAYSLSEDYNNGVLPIEFRLNNPYQMYGVAYGWEDIDWARKTIDLVPEHLKDLDSLYDKTVDNFINFWLKKIYG